MTTYDIRMRVPHQHGVDEKFSEQTVFYLRKHDSRIYSIELWLSGNETQTDVENIISEQDPLFSETVLLGELADLDG